MNGFTTELLLYLRSLRHNRTVIGLMLVMIALPFGGTVLSWSLIFCVALWLSDWNRKEKLSQLKSNSWVWLFVAFYGLVAAGYLYSSDKEEATFKIVQKLVLLLLPLCVATSVIAHRTALLKTYVLSVTTVCVFLEIVALIEYLTTGDSSAFFYNVYSRFMHTSYFALMVTVALIIVLINGLQNSGDGRSAFIWLLLTAFLSLNVLQSSSRAGFLGLFIIAAIAFYSWFRYRDVIPVRVTLAVVGIAVFTLALAWMFSRQTRLATLSTAGQQTNTLPAHAESSQVRLLIWSEAIGLIKKNPLSGYGTGDANNMLFERYAAAGMTDALAKHYNAHNQFLQTWLANGLVALGLLLLIFISGLWKAIREIDLMGLAFFLVTGFHLLFESMLERREGLFVSAMFAALFLHRNSNVFQEKSSSPNPSSTRS